MAILLIAYDPYKVAGALATNDLAASRRGTPSGQDTCLAGKYVSCLSHCLLTAYKCNCAEVGGEKPDTIGNDRSWVIPEKAFRNEGEKYPIPWISVKPNIDGVSRRGKKTQK